MIGELATAIPVEGGFYHWVARAMEPFWGFQEAWLSLAASVFDMAIYSTTFVLYPDQSRIRKIPSTKTTTASLILMPLRPGK